MDNSIAEHMGMSGISKSQVSRFCEDFDGRVKAFLDLPLESDWPYLWIDAIYLKVSRGGRVVSVAAITAVGVNSLGIQMGTSEAEPVWTEFLRKFTRRGLRGVKLVVSEAMEATRPLSLRSCASPGSAAASTSCAMFWPMPARAGGALPVLLSAPRSRRRHPSLPAANGGLLPIRFAPRCPSSLPS